ncbi:hypothetical protein BC567DRAFT_180972 [Phyllosticta citribraziliensis]
MTRIKRRTCFHWRKQGRDSLEGRVFASLSFPLPSLTRLSPVSYRFAAAVLALTLLSHGNPPTNRDEKRRLGLSLHGVCTDLVYSATCRSASSPIDLPCPIREPHRNKTKPEKRT